MERPTKNNSIMLNVPKFKTRIISAEEIQKKSSKKTFGRKIQEPKESYLKILTRDAKEIILSCTNEVIDTFKEYFITLAVFASIMFHFLKFLVFICFILLKGLFELFNPKHFSTISQDIGRTISTQNLTNIKKKIFVHSLIFVIGFKILGSFGLVILCILVEGFEFIKFGIGFIQLTAKTPKKEENTTINYPIPYEKIETTERFYEVLNKELKTDAIILSGNENSFTDFVQNLSDSQIAHVQYLHYLGKDECDEDSKQEESINEEKLEIEDKENYQIIESAITRDANGVEVNNLYNINGNKLMQDGSRFERFYLAKLNWEKIEDSTGVSKDQYANRILPFIDDVKKKNLDIPYDFAACSSLTVKKVLTLFGFKGAFEQIEEILANWIVRRKKKIQNPDGTSFFERTIYFLGLKVVEKFKLFFFQKNNFRSMICTEMVAYLLMKAGVIKKDLNISVFTPQDILELDIYEKLYAFNFDSHYVPDHELLRFSTNSKPLKEPPKRIKK